MILSIAWLAFPPALDALPEDKITFELPHNKTNKMACVPSED